MAKDPIFPLYYNDIARTCSTWTDEEYGAYIRLLVEQWANGGLPKDYQRLTRIATSLATTWPLLKTKFKEVDGMLINENLEAIRAKRIKFKEKQSENVRKRYQSSTKQPTKNVPLENEYENEIENKLKGAFDEIYLDQEKVKWPHLDFRFEFETFKNKVRGSPDNYKSHDTGGMRLAFQSQLRNAKKKSNGQVNKRQQNTNDLLTGIMERHGNILKGGSGG